MSLFEWLLEQHERRRHAAILGALRPARGPVRTRRDGFLPSGQAAEAMGIDEEELVDMARRGVLEWRELGGEVYVRPAVVSILGVR